MSPSGQYQVAVDYFGIIAYSNNYGINWSKLTLNTSASTLNFTSVTITNPNIDTDGILSFFVTTTDGIYSYGEIVNTLYINSPIFAPAYYIYSDCRIKENIQEIESTELTTDNLRPVKYLNKINNQYEYGLIAHEVQDLIPELVTGNRDSEEYQAINYTGLIPIMIKEIKCLKCETICLKNEIETLKNELSELKQKIT